MNALFLYFPLFCYAGRVDETESLMYYSDSETYGSLNDENFEPAFDINPTTEQMVKKIQISYFDYNLNFKHA